MSLKEDLSRAVGAVANAVGDVAKKTAAQTRVMAEIAKLNLKITQEEDKIKKAQTELGKLYYNDFEAGLPIEAETYLPLCDEIKACKETIAQYRTQLEELKTKPEAQQCPEEPTCGEQSCEEPAAEEGCCAGTAETIEFTVVDEPADPTPETPAEEPSDGTPEA